MAEVLENPVESVDAAPSADVPADTQTDAEAEASFAEGFGSDEPSAEPPAPETPAPASAKEPEAEVKVEAVPVEPVVEYAKITAAQFQDLLTRVGQSDETKAAVDKVRGDAFGKIGGLERTIKQLQEATPVGQAITVTGEDLASFKSEFPDLADNLAKDLTKVLSKFKGTAPVADPIDNTERVNTLVAERVKQASVDLERKFALERLSDKHEDWQTVVGPADSATPFRAWLHAKGAAYESNILNSWDTRVTAKAITEFKTHQQALSKAAHAVSPTAADARAERLKQAMTPRGGAQPITKPRDKTAEQQFEEGFNS